jgi:biopolymer transport protein ExbB/TolQ
MAKKVEIELDVKGNIVESTKNLKALKLELKGLDVGTAEFKKLFNEIDDLEDKIKSAKGVSSDWIDSLENAGGPIGMLGAGLNKLKVATQSFGAALKATGIGLIVAAIGLLVAAFSKTEGSMKKLEPLMIMLEKLFAGLVEAFQPLLEAFVEIAMKVLPVFISGIKNFYGGLMALFTLVKEAGTGVGKILKGIFTLDTDALEEGYNQLKGSWDKTKESFNQFTNNFEKGYAKQTATQKKNAADAKDAADKALAERLKNMEANDKLSEAELQKMKEQELALATSEQQKLDIEKSFAKKSFDMRLQDINDKMALYKKDSLEYKNLLADRTKLEAERIKEETGFKTQQVELTKKTNKELLDEELQALSLKKAQGEIKEDEYQKSLYDIKKKYTTDKKELNDIEIAYEQYKTDRKKKLAEDERNIALNRLQSEINNIDALNALQQYDFEEDLKRLQDKRLKLDESEKLELAATELNEVERNKVLQKYADLRKGIMLDEVAVAKAANAAKIQVQLTYLQAIERFGELLQQISNGNRELAITGLLIQKAAALASIAVNARKNFIDDGGIKSPLAWANLAVAGVSALSVVASAIKGVQDIKNAGKSSGGGSGGDAPMAGNSAASLGKNYEKGGMIGGNRHAQGGTMIEAEAGEAIMTRGAVTAFTPLLSMMNQMGGGTSFTQGAVGQSGYDSPKMETTMSQPQIIKTYVVSSEMTSEQERQARLKDLSTI